MKLQDFLSNVQCNTDLIGILLTFDDSFVYLLCAIDSSHSDLHINPTVLILHEFNFLYPNVLSSRITT